MSTLQRIARALTLIARGLVSTVLGNLSLAVLSLALALSLWLYVTDRENPEETRTFNSSIEVDFANVPTNLAIARTSAAAVGVRVAGPRNMLDDLSVDDFEATVDLGGLDEGNHSVGVDVTSSRARVSVVSVTPPRIDVGVEALRTKEVAVVASLVGSPQLGFAAGDQTVEPSRVTVSGAQSLVELVDNAVAEVQLTGLRIDLTDERVLLQPRDGCCSMITRVDINPATARVSVAIVQQEFSRDFIVAPSVTGQPADGFNVTGVRPDPLIVHVSGTLEVLGSIDAVSGVPTEEISIADARDDVVRTVQLSLPDGARLEGGSVRVVVEINPAVGEFSYSVVPRVNNVAQDLAVVVPNPVVIILAGDVPTLRAVAAGSIAAEVNAQGLGPGLYALPVQITPPSGTTIVRIEPEQLGVALSARP